MHKSSLRGRVRHSREARPLSALAAVAMESRAVAKNADRYMAKTSHRPSNKAVGQCKAIAAKACPFKHSQPHAPASPHVQTGSVGGRPKIFRTHIGFMSQLSQFRTLAGATAMSALILKNRHRQPGRSSPKCREATSGQPDANMPARDVKANASQFGEITMLNLQFFSI